MSDVDEGGNERRGFRLSSKSEHGSTTQAKSESSSGSTSPSRESKHSESRSRSQSKSGSSSKHVSVRHVSRSPSPSHPCRRRSRSHSNRPHSRRRKSRSTSPISNRSPKSRLRSHEAKEANSHGGLVDRANPDPSKCLGVFGLSLETTARDLRHVFSQYGRLTAVDVVFHQRSGRSRGYAFVYFERLEDSKEAMERANGMEIDGRVIRVDYSITKRAHTPTPGIYMERMTTMMAAVVEFAVGAGVLIAFEAMNDATSEATTEAMTVVTTGATNVVTTGATTGATADTTATKSTTTDTTDAGAPHHRTTGDTEIPLGLIPTTKGATEVLQLI
ncbi:transformer-2 protein homolog alpha isoform X1 [Hippocampus zosterae]|uniref:transformer-2 protein homolog alpha isoform X1 n=1 Tax=Hippocampus zosterae TaxID=109293 RepID=UPI00223CD03D|nr:transformer-2 protein homolog alpha isoform X1 [Hippocampus zosterae]